MFASTGTLSGAGMVAVQKDKTTPGVVKAFPHKTVSQASAVAEWDCKWDCSKHPCHRAMSSRSHVACFRLRIYLSLSLASLTYFACECAKRCYAASSYKSSPPPLNISSISLLLNPSVWNWTSTIAISYTFVCADNCKSIHGRWNSRPFATQ